MTITVYTDNLVNLNGTYVGRIDRASYQMTTGVKGKTTFYTAKDGDHTNLSVPHEIDVPLYVPRCEGSVSQWKINPAFEDLVASIVA